MVWRMEFHSVPAPALGCAGRVAAHRRRDCYRYRPCAHRIGAKCRRAFSHISFGARGPAALESVEVVNDESDAQALVGAGATDCAGQLFGTAVKAFVGDTACAVARLLPPEIYHDPGVWSRADFPLDEGITSTATVVAYHIDRIGRSPGAFVSCRVSAWQRASTERLIVACRVMRYCSARCAFCRRRGDAFRDGGHDRTYLTHALRVGFERTGSFHMLVVSACILPSWRSVFLDSGRSAGCRGVSRCSPFAASFAYALFTGFATPVQRSFWMVTLYPLGRLLYRERSPLNTIGFAALCLLVVSPRSLFSTPACR